MADRPADRIRKLVAFAIADSNREGSIARAKALDALAKMDTELLDTLAGQRKRLLEDLREESKRLHSRNGRATKTETGELVSSALVLLQHYERVDALIAAVLLARLETGGTIGLKERQQLDGPVEDWLDRWHRDIRERRRTEREQRRAERRQDG